MLVDSFAGLALLITITFFSAHRIELTQYHSSHYTTPSIRTCLGDGSLSRRSAQPSNSADERSIGSALCWSVGRSVGRFIDWWMREVAEERNNIAGERQIDYVEEVGSTMVVQSFIFFSRRRMQHLCMLPQIHFLLT